MALSRVLKNRREAALADATGGARRSDRRRVARGVAGRSGDGSRCAVDRLGEGLGTARAGERERAADSRHHQLHEVAGAAETAEDNIDLGRAQHRPGRGQAPLSNVGALRAVTCGVQLCAIQTSHASLVCVLAGASGGLDGVQFLGLLG